MKNIPMSISSYFKREWKWILISIFIMSPLISFALMMAAILMSMSARR